MIRVHAKMAETCREETTAHASQLCNCCHGRGHQCLDPDGQNDEAGLGDLKLKS